MEVTGQFAFLLLFKLNVTIGPYIVFVPVSDCDYLIPSSNFLKYSIKNNKKTFPIVCICKFFIPGQKRLCPTDI